MAERKLRVVTVECPECGLRAELREKAGGKVSVSLSRRLLAPFLSPFLDGERFVADVINYIAGLIFSTIKPMTR